MLLACSWSFDKLVVCLTLASVRYELSGCDSLIREGASGRAPLAGALRGPSLADSRQFWNVSPVLSFCPSCLALVPFDKLVVCLTLASVRYELSGCDSLIREGASGRAPLAGALRGPSLADSRQFWNVRILIEDDG